MFEFEKASIPESRGHSSQYSGLWEALLATKGKSALKVSVEQTNVRKIISAISARCRATQEWRLRSQIYEQGTLLWLEKKQRRK